MYVTPAKAASMRCWEREPGWSGLEKSMGQQGSKTMARKTLNFPLPVDTKSIPTYRSFPSEKDLKTVES